MGRAQVVQAQTAGVEPHTDMNPVLLKPEADSRSQVVINGKAVGSFEARKYWGDQTEVWTAVTEAYDRLASQYDVIVLEGAGSPAEVNLRDRDIVNMRMAAYAQASVILVGDIDRGGVFASLLGTMELLTPNERSLVKATLINRFRGDLALLDPLPELIAERTRVPVLGVVPFVYDLQIKDEDGVTFGDYDPPGALPTSPPYLRGRELEGGSKRPIPKTPNDDANSWPDGIVADTLPIIGSYVNRLFDSPDILRRLLNTTAETHNLPEPRVTEFSIEAEYDRLAQTVRESIDMNLINTLIR